MLEEPQPSPPYGLPNDDDSSSQSGDHAMPGPICRLCSDSLSRPRISGEDDAGLGDVKMGFDPALNLFNEGYNDGGPDDDGERSSSPH